MKKLRILILFSTSLMVAACATAPRERPSDHALGAHELAQSALADSALSAVPAAAAITDDPITGLPAEEPPGPPPEEINNSGSMPAVRTITAPTLQPLAKHFGPGQPVSLDLEQVELRQVLEQLADVMGISLVIDSTIADKVTVRTAPDKPLQRDDIWPLFQLLLLDNQITMEKKGNIYHLKKNPQSALADTLGGTQAGLEHSDAPEVMQITPLRYITVDAGLQALQPIVEPQGRIITLPTLNVVGITTSPARLARVNSLLNLIDADPFVHRGMRLFRLKNSGVEEITEDLQKIFEAVEGANPTYHIIPLERINAVLVVAPPQRGFSEVERWVRILDEENEESGEQVFIYRVRNLEAGKLATTLSEVFESDDDDKHKPRTRQEQQKADEAKKNDNAPPPPPAPKPAPAAREGQLAVSAELDVNIVADEDTNSLIIRARPRDYRQLLETILVLDKAPKEVMVNVVVAEVELTKSTEFGIDWQALLGGRINVEGTEQRRTTVGTGFAVPSVGTDGFSGFGARYVGNSITAILNLVSTDNDVEVLSRPSILVRDNQEATLNVGAEEPTITRLNQTTNISTNVTTSNEVQYRQTGIILKVKPHINEDGLINMEVSQEVSSLGAERTTQNLPSFSTRKFETSLLVRDGNAIILGGLIETRVKNDLQGIRGLMDLPIAGSLFSAESKEHKRTELVVIIVPEIIDPLADNRAYMQKFKRRMSAVSALLNNEEIPVLEGRLDFPEAEPR